MKHVATWIMLDCLVAELCTVGGLPASDSDVRARQYNRCAVSSHDFITRFEDSPRYGDSAYNNSRLGSAAPTGDKAELPVRGRRVSYGTVHSSIHGLTPNVSGWNRRQDLTHHCRHLTSDGTQLTMKTAMMSGLSDNFAELWLLGLE